MDKTIRLRQAGETCATMILLSNGQEVDAITTEVAFEAAFLIAEDASIRTVLDVGCGRGEHARALRHVGKSVTTLDPVFPADIEGDLLDTTFEQQFDCVWCSHVLEHQRNVGLFVDALVSACKPGGMLALTVPPEVSPGFLLAHPNQFTVGLLMYHLVMAGVDCREARALTYGYNASVVVRTVPNLMKRQSWAHEVECEVFFPSELARTMPNQIWGAARGIGWRPALPEILPHANTHIRRD